MKLISLSEMKRSILHGYTLFHGQSVFYKFVKIDLLTEGLLPLNYN